MQAWISSTRVQQHVGLTSQPALNSIVAAMDSTERETGIDPDGIQEISDYWAAVRPVYAGFESDMMTGSAEIYKYEMPGGRTPT